MRKLAVAAFLESLNRNFKSCQFYLCEISRLLKRNYKLDEVESVYISYVHSYLNAERIIFDGYITEVPTHIPLFKDYQVIQEQFEKEGTKEALKFHCGDLGCFYIKRDELLPVNINNVGVSNFTGRVIKGRIISIKNVANISYSQALEWFKLTPFCPFLDDLSPFNPY